MLIIHLPTIPKALREQILEDNTNLVSRVIKHLQSFSNIRSRIQKIKKLLIIDFQKRDFH